MKRILIVLLLAVFVVPTAFAEDLVITMQMVSEQGMGRDIGTITVTDSQYGLILVPKLGDLTPGLHGFHVHEKPDCSHVMKEGKAVPALAAGGHYDPAAAGNHEGPYGKGHLGDLPALYVAADGKAVLPVLAPRLKVSDLKGRSLMIHAGGDNYSDQPEKLGGGGARVACGMIK